ncbi:transcriptional regulator [Caulobacter segnis]|uniref:Transcriptional regulator, HxlR family n=2 Tax=Caulobacter segnis TaxID=88688 RepID=D5VHI8_CAUST|nr:helix-turn-helix domain-containing protein [Caulobacter segnis]ADG08846.1 transcriptional regulator, HxlR family [Caulobacter segnis ATCC 21756]AVQ00688.1 transcriptional regulator [Caulobacter segnis]
MEKSEPSEMASRRPLSEIVVNGGMRGNLMAAACPSREVLNHVTSRWGVLVLMALETRTLRFSQLKRQIGGVSERMLAQTLKHLESDGFVRRQAFEVVPPHVEYSLTPLGLEVAERVRGLADWIQVNLGRILPNWDPEVLANYAPETVA